MARTFVGFADPMGANVSDVHALLSRVADLVATSLSSAGSRPPLPPRTDLDDVGVAWRGHPSTNDELLEIVKAVLERSINLGTPGYIGHMQTAPTLASVVADMVVSACNNSMLSVETAPLWTRVEPELMRLWARSFGLPEESGGLMAAGGSMANLHALTLARNCKTASLESGVSRSALPPVIIASQYAHTSITKSAMILGLGTRGVVSVAAAEDFRMDVEATRRAIQAAIAAGQNPFCLVATAGTTTVGAIDPLGPLRDVATEFDLWFHVDAAYGGAAILSDNTRFLLDGIEGADSITFDPQKWMCISSTCAMVLVRREEWLVDYFRIPLPYMRQVDGLMNLGEISIPGTRYADAFKLMLSMRHCGLEAYSALLDAQMLGASALARALSIHPYLQLAAPPVINIVCFRGIPNWVPPEQWDDWNEGLQEFLIKNGVFVSRPQLAGAAWLRVVLLNPFVSTGDTARVSDLIQAYADETRSRGS